MNLKLSFDLIQLMEQKKRISYHLMIILAELLFEQFVFESQREGTQLFRELHILVSFFLFDFTLSLIFSNSTNVIWI